MSSRKSRRSRRSKPRAKLQQSNPRLTQKATAPDEDPDEAIRRGKRRIRGSVEKILRALQTEAEDGSCAHAKLLFDFAGIKFGAEEAPEEDSLSGILLQRLEEICAGAASSTAPILASSREATAPKVE